MSFQQQVKAWLDCCFGLEIANNPDERNHRFLEESLELVQACGCTSEEAHNLVDFVFSRTKGNPEQEVGGVMVTLAALCSVNSIDMKNAGNKELTRILKNQEQIKQKHAAKPDYKRVKLSSE